MTALERTSSDATIERLSTPSAVALFWICFSLVFAAIQLLSSSTLTLDSAVTVENVQRHLAGGYQLRNPPLFDWMYYFAQSAIGDGILAHTILRYVFFAAIGILHYVAFLQVGCGRRMAAAFSYSLVFFIWIASDFHYHYTHSMPLLVIGLAAWVTAIAYVDRPRAWLAALLGLLIGFGTISKWSFLLPVAGTLCAFLFDRRARTALLDRRSLLILLLAIVPLIPVALWLGRVDGNVASVVHNRLVGSSSPYAERALKAILEYLEAIVLYLLPWPIFVGLIGYLARKRESGPRPMHANGRLAVAATVFTAGLGFAGVAALGVTNMGTRYMFPVLLTAPIAMAAWIAVRVEERQFAEATMRTATVVTIVAVVIRFWSFHILDGFLPENNEQRIPYAALTAELTARGFGAAQFIAASERDAGNLIAHMPGARAIALNSLRAESPPADPLTARPCVAIWSGSLEGSATRPELPPQPESIAALAGTGAGRIDDVFVDWPRPLYGEDRHSVWRIVPLPEDSRACRSARGL
jgi:4-amino-4-deoxy-L-arabinose transferase-like glycosyltransferase